MSGLAGGPSSALQRSKGIQGSTGWGVFICNKIEDSDGHSKHPLIKPPSPSTLLTRVSGDPDPLWAPPRSPGISRSESGWARCGRFDHQEACLGSAGRYRPPGGPGWYYRDSCGVTVGATEGAPGATHEGWNPQPRGGRAACRPAPGPALGCPAVVGRPREVLSSTPRARVTDS